MNLNEINTNQYVAELKELENGAAIEVKMPPLAAVAIITYIQLACRDPEIKLGLLHEIAIEAAKDIQNVFHPNSTTYKVLSMGWNPEHDDPTEKI